jgi:S-adenosylmethionine synthetase
MKNIDLSPKGIIDRLQLKRPIYRATAAYGHFGRNDFPWEQLDLVPLFSTLSA